MSQSAGQGLSLLRQTNLADASGALESGDRFDDAKLV
jgi:hypothetical protein